MANILHRLANTLIFRRDYVEAERLARESVPLHRELHGNRHPETGYGLRILGWCLLKQHKYDEAETCLREALAIFAEQYEHINQGWVGAIEDLVLVLEAKSDKTGLEALRAEVAARARQTLERRPDDTGPLLYAATALVRVGDVDGAADICSHVVSVTPGKLTLPRDSINEIAWLLATHPNPNRRNAELAVELAQQAVESVPRAGFLWNTLGIAHYRAGEWKAAVEMLEKSMELRDGGASSDFFFLAMAHWQLGEKDEAQRWYGQAVEWMDKNKPDNEELRRFRAEAVELLGIAEPKSAEPQPAENKAPKTGNPAPASPPKP
jgi:tetratricopeptide (TPR) repeat protein